MKYISEFREEGIAKNLSDIIKHEVHADSHYKLMEFCGGHTHAIHRYGIPSLLPGQVELIHGPGCPVCVLPIARIDQAIMLSEINNIIFCSYGDMLRIPGTKQDSLLKAKARGADIRIVYSPLDAISIAKKNPDKQIIFFAIGFETTTPATAYALATAKRQAINNFTIFCNHVLTPVAMSALLESTDANDVASIDGFIGPAHVSIIIGSDAYQTVCHTYHKPIVIAGFEPLDIMHSILMLIRQINSSRCEVENQYIRAVNTEGNKQAKSLINAVFELRDTFEWRGLGFIDKSGLKIRESFKEFDAEHRFPLSLTSGKEHKACECGSILKGIKRPKDCKVFATVCTPQNPLGACMVSAEGACAAVYTYDRA